MQQGEQRLMVNGLNDRYRIQPDALVRAVQALVVDAEPGGSGDAQSREILIFNP